MQFNEECITCLVNRQTQLAAGLGTEDDRFSFMKDVLQAILDAPAGVAAPYMIPAFEESYARHFGIVGPYEAIKKEANERVLAMLPAVRSQVAAAEDPVRLALQFAQTGNYLDFAVLPKEKIDSELMAAIAQTPENALDETEYTHFRADLERARSLLILGDNAGEIAFDRVLAETLRMHYPALAITYCVRGGNAQNDATRADARAVGIEDVVSVIDSGSCIPGTELAYCGQELLRALDRADLVLAKGQANFETLFGCGKNIYYIFLCKCARFARRFGVETMTGMFLNELRAGKTPL